MNREEPLSYWTAVARIGFEEDLERLLQKKSMSRADLAAAMGVSPPFVTKILNRGNNYELQTLAKLARGVGAILEIRLADEGREVVRTLDLETARWVDRRGGPTRAAAPQSSSPPAPSRPSRGRASPKRRRRGL